MRIFDGHNDTLTAFYERQGDDVSAFFRQNEVGHLDVPRARQGALTGGLFAIFVRPPMGSPERDPMYGVMFTEEGYDVSPRSPLDPAYAEMYTHQVMNFADHLVAASNGTVVIARTAAEIETSSRRETLSMVLALEGAEAIRADLSNLVSWYDRGVRSLGLVWSRPNAFGEGVPFRFPHRPDTGAGLTGAGKALVEACNALGILVDGAHLNEQGFRDVAALSHAPLVVTHSDVHAICPSTRNLTDAQIDAVAASGGVIGINFETGNTHPRSSFDTTVPLTQITQHIDYVAQRVGVDHVAFGSDFDGADMPDALKDSAGLPKLIEQLQRQGYDEASIEKIVYGNWLRVFRDTWKA